MRAGILALLGAFPLAGCSYDWSVPTDGGTLDAAVDSTPPVDASIEAEGASPIPDASASEAAADVLVESSVDCAALEVQVQQDKAKAIACTPITTACMTTVQDECECTVVVYAQNTPLDDYKAAIQQLLASGCKPQCPGCGPTPTEGLCVIADGGGVGNYACYQ